MSELTGKQWKERLETDGVSTFDVWAIVTDLIRTEEKLENAQLQWSITNSKLAELKEALNKIANFNGEQFYDPFTRNLFAEKLQDIADKALKESEEE